MTSKFYHVFGGNLSSYFGQTKFSLPGQTGFSLPGQTRFSASDTILFCKKSYVRSILLLVLLLTFTLVAFTACDADLAATWAEEDVALSAQILPLDVNSTTEEPNELSCEYITKETSSEQKDTEKQIRGEVIAIFPLPLLEPEPEPSRYKIALTFDDGPSRFTPDILDILEQYNSRATFFVLGTHVEAGADTVLRAAQHGNEIAGHSWNHTSFANLNEYALREQILDTSAAIEAVTGIPSSQIFRPPFGTVNNRVRRVAKELEYTIVNWSIDPEDWRIRDADHIYDFVMENAVHGAIVVLHDLHLSTTEAVARLVPSLIAKGFELVTVSELLDYIFEDLIPGGLYFGLRK